MTNPYEPTLTPSPERTARTQPRRHVFAGLWLCLAGLLHFVVINLVSGNRTFVSLDWSASFFVVLGLLVLFRFRLGMIMTRLLGSFTIMGLILTTVLMATGFNNGGEMTYGSLKLVNPKPWQVAIMLGAFALTILPPWWALQRMLADK